MSIFQKIKSLVQPADPIETYTQYVRFSLWTVLNNLEQHGSTTYDIEKIFCREDFVMVFLGTCDFIDGTAYRFYIEITPSKDPNLRKKLGNATRFAFYHAIGDDDKQFFQKVIAQTEEMISSNLKFATQNPALVDPIHWFSHIMKSLLVPELIYDAKIPLIYQPWYTDKQEEENAVRKYFS